MDSSNEILNANAHFVNHLFTFISSMSLKCAVQLGIADAIHSHGKPMPLSALAAALPINPQKAKSIPQLMQLLIHLGYFSEETTPGGVVGYALTPASQLLLKDHPCSVAPFLSFILNPALVNPWVDLSEWFGSEDDVTPFRFTNRMTIWECAGNRPEINQVLNNMMASDSKMVADFMMSNPLSRKLFEGVDSLVDVGGGLGEMARAVSEAFPHIKCKVLDLPHVVKGLEGTHNLSFIGGDMLESIPPANAVLLKWVLHDWNDEDAVKILKQCKKAITFDGCVEGIGKVIIIDIVMDKGENDKKDHKMKETQLLFDMEMMVLLGAKERTKGEWEKLFSEAGFHGGFKVLPILGWRSVIEVYP